MYCYECIILIQENYRCQMDQFGLFTDWSAKNADYWLAANWSVKNVDFYFDSLNLDVNGFTFHHTSNLCIMHKT